MSLIGNLIVRVGCDVSNLLEGFDKAGKHASDFAKTTGAVFGGELLAHGFEKALELGKEAIGEIMNVAHEASERIHQLSIEADKFGTSVNSFQVLKVAAQEANLDIDTLDKNMKKMLQNASTAAIGGGGKAFRELGLDAGHLIDLKPEQALGLIADQLQNVQNQADKIRLAEAIFGRGGASLLPMLKDGSDGLKRFNEEMQRNGELYSKSDIARGEYLHRLEERTKRLQEAAGKTGLLGNLNENWEGVKSGFADLAIDTGKQIKWWNGEAQQEELEKAKEQEKEWTAMWDRMDKCLENGFKPSKSAVNHFSEFMDKLTEQDKTVGMSANEIELYHMKLARIPDASIKAAEALMKHTEAAKQQIDTQRKLADELENAAKKRLDDEQRLGKQITEQNKTPIDHYIDKINELNVLVKNGVINWQTYGRAVDKAQADIGKDYKPASHDTNYAVEYGTKEMFSMIEKMLEDKDKQQYEKNILDEAKTHTQILTEIKDGVGEKPKVVDL